MSQIIHNEKFDYPLVQFLNNPGLGDQAEVLFGRNKEKIFTLSSSSLITWINLTRDPIKFTKDYGVRPTDAAKAFNRFIRDRDSFLHDMKMKYAYRNGGMSFQYAKMVENSIHIIRQCVDDNQWNIIPLVILLHKTPKELKEFLGKGLWKRLCGNSKSRNKLIFETLRKINNLTTWNKEKIKVTLDRVNSFRSCVLKSGISHNEVYGIASMEQSKFDYVLTNLVTNEYPEVNVLLRDTTAMELTIAELRQDVKVGGYKKCKSIKELREYHDSLVIHLNENRNRQYRKIKDPNFDISFKIPRNFEMDEYRAVLITTMDDLEREGSDMHHCVSTYENNIRRGTYLVYSITGPDHRSTLGIVSFDLMQIRHGYSRSQSPSHMRERAWAIDQHKAFCNSEVVDENALKIASHVLSSLNNFE